MDNLKTYIEFTANIIESAGILIIGLGSLFVLVRYFFLQLSGSSGTYADLRHQLGKVILLGLEILVAADIIATVSTEPTMNSVLVLAVIVLVRTFLSFSLQVELEGRFPWQQKKQQVKQ